jgi:uncharacterized membrane protein YwzB
MTVVVAVVVLVGLQLAQIVHQTKQISQVLHLMEILVEDRALRLQVILMEQVVVVVQEPQVQLNRVVLVVLVVPVKNFQASQLLEYLAYSEAVVVVPLLLVVHEGWEVLGEVAPVPSRVVVHHRRL